MTRDLAMSRDRDAHQFSDRWLNDGYTLQATQRDMQWITRKLFERTVFLGHLTQKAVLYTLHRTFYDFINTVMRHDCHDYIGNI